MVYSTKPTRQSVSDLSVNWPTHHAIGLKQADLGVRRAKTLVQTSAIWAPCSGAVPARDVDRPSALSGFRATRLPAATARRRRFTPYPLGQADSSKQSCRPTKEWEGIEGASAATL